MQNSKSQFKIQNLISPFLVIAFAVILRLIPHPPNMAPIAAMALFGGVYLNKRYALLVPILAMVISDFFLGFDASMPFVYGSFLLTGLLGLWLRKHKAVYAVFGVSLFSSFLFFVITNFGVWLLGNIYPKTAQGFIECYVAAIPFFRNTVIGDLFYVGLFFGSYELVLRFFASLRMTRSRRL